MKSSLAKKLDRLWGSIGRERAMCEVCESLPKKERVKYTVLNAHHIIGRVAHSLRWDLKNRIFLCPTHHVFGRQSAHNNPLWFNEWLKKNKPETYSYLKKNQHNIKQWTKEELEELLSQMKSFTK